MPKHFAHNADAAPHTSASPNGDRSTISASFSSDAADSFGSHVPSGETHYSESTENAQHAAPATSSTKRSRRRQAAREARAQRKQERRLRKDERARARKNRRMNGSPQYVTTVQTTHTSTISTRTTSTDAKSTTTKETVEEHTNTVTKSTFALNTRTSARRWRNQDLATTLAHDGLVAPRSDSDLNLFSRTIARLASQALAWIRPTPTSTQVSQQPFFGFIHQDVVHQFQEAPILGLTRLVSHHEGVLTRPESPSEHPPLILIHGLAGSSGNFAPMRVWLSRNRPRPVHVFDYREHTDMFPAAEAFGQWLDELSALYEDDVQFEILAHSMGGLITRLALRDAQRAARISHVLTLGTPHQGTRLATLGATTYLRQLQVGSPVFQTLEEFEADTLPYTLTSVWTQRDILVLPAQHAILPGYASYAMHQSTHLSWLLHPQLIDDVFNILDAQRIAQRFLRDPLATA